MEAESQDKASRLNALWIQIRLLETPELVATKIAALFPIHDPAEIYQVLTKGRGIASGPGIQLPVLKRSGSSLEELHYYVEMANSDLRDIMLFAIYPNEVNYISEMDSLDTPIEIREQDLQQYLDWLRTNTS